MHAQMHNLVFVLVFITTRTGYIAPTQWVSQQEATRPVVLLAAGTLASFSQLLCQAKALNSRWTLTHAHTHTHTHHACSQPILLHITTHTHTVHNHSFHVHTPTIYTYDAYLPFTDSFTFYLNSHRHWMFLCALQKHNKVVKFLLLHDLNII